MDPNVATNQPVSPVSPLPTPSSIQSVSLSPTPPLVEEKKSFPWMWIAIIVCLVFLLGAGFIFIMKYHTSAIPSATANPTSSNGVPQAKITDLSPSVPNSQKTVVLVEHSDSSMEKFIMATDLVAGYLKALPVGDRVVSQSPAAQ